MPEHTDKWIPMPNYRKDPMEQLRKSLEHTAIYLVECAKEGSDAFAVGLRVVVEALAPEMLEDVKRLDWLEGNGNVMVMRDGTWRQAIDAAMKEEADGKQD